MSTDSQSKLSSETAEPVDISVTESLSEIGGNQTPGELLKAAREKAGLSEAQVADRLKIPESYVTAIDRNEFDALPGLIFARGYIRAYARMVGLDGDDMIARVDRHTGDDSSDTPSLTEGKPVTTSRRPMSPLLAWGGTLATVVVVGLVSYFGWNHDSRNAQEPEQDVVEVHNQVENVLNPPVDIQPTQEAQSSEVQPAEVESVVEQAEEARPDGALIEESEAAVPEPEEQPVEQEAQLVGQSEPVVEESEVLADPADGNVRLLIRFDEDCWVQVKDMSGNSLYTDVQKAGSELDLEVPATVQVRFGNVQGVSDLNFDGRNVQVSAPTSGRKVASLVLGSEDAG